MKIENRQQALAILAITAVAILAGDRFIVSPLVHAWKARAERTAELRTRIQEGELLLDRESVLQQRWARMKTNTLPEDPSVAQDIVSKAFYRWCDESRVTLTGLTPYLREPDEDYSTMEYRATVSGTLPALTRFLHEIEKDPLALRVESVKIESRDDNGQQIAVSLQLSGLLLKPKRS